MFTITNNVLLTATLPSVDGKVSMRREGSGERRGGAEGSREKEATKSGQFDRIDLPLSLLQFVH